MKHNVASILIGVAIIGSSAGAQNLILNGSFESPSVPPNVVSSTAPTSWLAGGGFVAIIRGDYSPGYPLAQDGQQYATVGNSSSLSQAFTIDSPGTYELSWFDSTEFNGPDQHSPYSVSVTDSMSNIVASADFDANATALRVWAPRSIQFTLVAKTYTLRFDGHAGVFAERSLIDNISLQANVPGWRIFPVATNPVPEVSLSAAFDGVNYLLAIQGGLVDHDEVTYQLFSKTGTLVGPKTSTGHFGSIPHVAFDGNHPVGGVEFLRVFRRVLLTRAEFVEIVVVRHVLVGVFLFSGAKRALEKAAEL